TLTTLIYLVCYVMMYVGYFKLIFTEKNLKRTYSIPGGIVVKFIVAICGICTSVFAFCMSFTPSTALTSSQTVTFIVLLVVCFCIAVVIPIIISAFQKVYARHVPEGELKIMHYKLVRQAAQQSAAQSASVQQN
ncbi:MAG: hypothetical protein IIZ04_02055, partial [Aeriscardovia sp.]|nr:hypothetical protein [Aeriscardovia sp.]